MHSITVSSYVDASPEKVWDTIGDPGAISHWHPAIASSTVTGAERLCTLANGAKVHERIESVDAEGRTYAYSITESPLPLASYQSTIKVDSDGNGSMVTWGARFEPSGAAAEEVAELLGSIYQAGLSSLRNSL